ncbi:hypothetical protein J2S17_005268, partial [Cytobacillus purgationiresistens]|nr:hypothetical protein [Cytobacillus purgationiresistens]
EHDFSEIPQIHVAIQRLEHDFNEIPQNHVAIQ